jgi:ribosomal protein L40E
MGRQVNRAVPSKVMWVSRQMPKGCSSCGYDNENDATFCRKCGTSLAEIKKTFSQLPETQEEPSPSNAIEPRPAGVATKLSSAVASLRGSRARQFSSPNAEYERLVSKFEKLSTLNKTLKEELRMTQERINQIDGKIATSDTETDETLRGILATMTRLLEETDRKVP